MSQTSDAAQGPITLSAGPRVIRAVAPPDAPWAGSLARDHEGRPCLLVDAALVPSGVATAPSDSGHVIGVRDLVRRPGGLAVVLPWCTQPLGSVLAHRREAGVGVSPGEAVTLAVSVLRGTVQAPGAGDGPGACGEWWLDDEARPLLVPGRGEPVAAAARTVLDEIRELTGDAGVRAGLAAARALADRPEGMAFALADVEGRLFSAAAPEALATRVLAPVRARAVSLPPPADPERGWPHLLPHVDAPIADMASAAVTALWRRLRADRPARGRRRPILWAGAAGALVLAGGLLWPQAPSAPATAGGPGTPTASPAARVPSTPTPTTTAPPPAPDQALPTVTDALLVRLAGCADAGCRGQVQEDAGASFPSGAAILPADSREITLLDDFGGVAVLRVHPIAAGTDQLVVIVQRHGSWLLRDIRDVAQQSG